MASDPVFLPLINELIQIKYFGAPSLDRAEPLLDLKKRLLRKTMELPLSDPLKPRVLQNLLGGRQYHFKIWCRSSPVTHGTCQCENVWRHEKLVCQPLMNEHWWFNGTTSTKPAVEVGTTVFEKVPRRYDERMKQGLHWHRFTCWDMYDNHHRLLALDLVLKHIAAKGIALQPLRPFESQRRKIKTRAAKKQKLN